MQKCTFNMHLCHLCHEVLVKKLVDGFTEFAKVTLTQWNENESMVEFILAVGMPWANSSNSSGVFEDSTPDYTTPDCQQYTNTFDGGGTMINISCGVK